MRVKELFDEGARKYDATRRRVIYCFDDFYGTILENIPFAPEDRFSFLDIGAGTGLVSSLILEKFPRAEAHLIDISEKMIQKARERFSTNEGVRFYIQDYEKLDFFGSYPVIVSAMSIHHLSDPGKQRLIRKIFNLLSPSGCFIHAELALGATRKTEMIYQQRWRRHLEGAGIKKEELSTLYERMACDRPATLEQQLTWMHSAGFEDVDCFFKHYNFVVYGGRKPER